MLYQLSYLACTRPTAADAVPEIRRLAAARDSRARRIAVFAGETKNRPAAAARNRHIAGAGFEPATFGL
jgi:hypothetical protein